MAIDTTESAPIWLNLGEVARRLGVNYETVARWNSNGVWRMGRRVKLKVFYVGRCRKTRVEWVDEFLAACNDTPESPVTETAAAETRRRTREQVELAKRLRKGKA